MDTKFDQYQLGFYWQDDIRLSNKFSVSIGVRNEMQSHIDDRLNLMPRLGFTATPWGNRTAIRGGYGLFYDWYSANLYDQTLRVDGVSQRDLLILNPGYPNPFTGQDAQVLPRGRIQADPNLRLPQVHQVSLGVERQLAQNFSAQATYQMLRGHRQIRSININAPDEFGNRPDPTVGTVTQFESTGRSETDRLTLGGELPLPAAPDLREHELHARPGEEPRGQRDIAARQQPRPGCRVGSFASGRPPSSAGNGQRAVDVRPARQRERQRAVRDPLHDHDWPR